MQKFKVEVIKALAKATGLKKDQIAELVEVPPDPKLGDLSLPCFKLSKQLKKDPKKIAVDLAKKIKPTGLIKEVKVVGPYVNFFVNEQKLAQQTLKQILKEKDKYGKKEKIRKTAVVEFPSPNTNKPLHLGHLRNIVLGEAISRLLESQGYTVKRVDLLNDRGIHISKSMLAYQKWGKGKQPDKKPDQFVGDFYVMFSKQAKKSPKLIDEAQELLRNWEARDKKVRTLWKKMNTWAIKGFTETYKRLEIKHDKRYFESEMYEKGKKIVLDGVKKGLFYQKPDGAIAIDLGGNLGEKILIRADGTTVYITQDLFLANQKYKDYKFDKSIYVAANEQDYHFQVLFKLLEILKYKFAKNCHHLSYGMVYLPAGKMKSREGTVVDADDLLNELEAMAKIEVETRQQLREEKLKKLSAKIARAALNYYLLKHNPKTDMLFNPEESIALEGDTGPYQQYALVRAKKILEKIGKPTKASTKLKEKEELELAKYLSAFPEIVEQAANQYSPNIVANYAKELAAKFNLFYEKHSVIRTKDKELQKARTLLVWAFAQTLKNALGLLGIKEVELM